MQKSKPDYWLILITLCLLGFGLIMVFSTSYHIGSSGFNYSLIYKQTLLALIGIILFFIFANIPYKIYKKNLGNILIICFALLITVLIFGKETNGAKRWLELGNDISFQPSEMVKIGFIIYIASIMSQKQKVITSFGKAVIAPLSVIAVACTLLILQPHFSTALILLTTCLIIMFCSGLMWKHIMWLGLGLLPVVVIIFFAKEYRLNRLISVFDPLSDPLGHGYQTLQSLLAINTGGLTGLGLGKGIQKLDYLPEAHTDFIFSIIVEETGLIGASFILILFGMLFFRGIKIALQAQDLFGMLLAIGLISLLTIEVICNIGVATALLPVTGIPLPLISYGGTVLIVKLVQLGILLNISRYCQKKN